MPIDTKRTGGVVPDGVYRLQILESKEATNSGGEPVIALKLKIIDHRDQEGRLVWTNLTQTPKFRWLTELFLDAIGVPEEDGDVSAPWFEGKTAWAKLNKRQGTDARWFNNVQRFLTAEQADIELAKIAEENGTDEDADIVPSKRTSRPAPSSIPKGKKSAVIAEGVDDDAPF